MQKKRDKKQARPVRRRKKRPCAFCVDASKVLDYKDVSFVRRFMSDRAKILPSRISGCCARHQRMVAAVVKRARQMGLVPYSMD